MIKTDLSQFDNQWYKPGASAIVRLIWYFTSAVFFQSALLIPYQLKASILRLFGARVGKKVVIKPRVTIKYPWRLSVGDYAWIGEQVWIDNLDQVTIGNHACLSQGALLLTGNHDFKKASFDLIVKPIEIGEGAWIGARAMVTQGVEVGGHAVLTAGSVATKNLSPYTVYKGNPAEIASTRSIA
jgi:putative colanic acid biosynthesis acetyltransferase WcaF